MKCARCGYAVKVNYLKREGRCRLVCSGRSNLSACDAEIGIDPRELEAHLAPEIQRLFDACPDGDALPEDGARVEAVLDIEQKIARLVDVLPFEEKKLAAAELIERTKLEGESANVIWKA